ncbi:MAG: FkbM family methyltransferase [Candidatus Acidiferrum sp.]
MCSVCAGRSGPGSCWRGGPSRIISRCLGGSWSRQLMRHFPNANYLLVEAQEAAHGPALEKFKKAHPQVRVELCAAGNREGEIHFDASDPFSGVASAEPFPKNNIVVPMARLDTLVKQTGWLGPYLLKLDTHGFEVPILEGAVEILSRASMLIVEAYNFTLCPGALRFYELAAYLEQRGFRCVDVFDQMIRPSDRALWQMDMVFLPSNHQVFESNVYEPR